MFPVRRSVLFWIGAALCLTGPLFFVRLPHSVAGSAQGTTYHVTVKRPLWVFPSRIDAAVTDALMALDKVASGYRPDSEVSQFNHAATGNSMAVSPVMQRLLIASAVVYNASQGAFDPSAGKLFDLWDFRKPGWLIPEDSEVLAILAHLRMTHARSLSAAGSDPSAPQLVQHGGQSLVFDAIAQGLSVDMVAEALETLGIRGYFVEVGGEVRVRGGDPWRIGISYPEVGAEAWTLYGILRLKEGSVATSGTYRRVQVDDKTGVIRSHIVDPRTGYPVTHNVVSATVIHPNCAVADALATAVLVLGQEEGLALLDRMPGASGFVVVHREGVYTPYYSAAFPRDAFVLQTAEGKGVGE